MKSINKIREIMCFSIIGVALFVAPRPLREILKRSLTTGLELVKRAYAVALEQHKQEQVEDSANRVTLQ